MKAANVQMGTYIEYGAEHNGKDSKFKVDDHVRSSKYKFFLGKG